VWGQHSICACIKQNAPHVAIVGKGDDANICGDRLNGQDGVDVRIFSIRYDRSRGVDTSPLECSPILRRAVNDRVSSIRKIFSIFFTRCNQDIFNPELFEFVEKDGRVSSVLTNNNMILFRRQSII
jgi:hypothetical protein